MATKHWRRKLRITVGGGTVGGLSGALEGGAKDDASGSVLSGQTLNLDDLQTEFQVHLNAIQHPDYAYVRITNLSDDTSNQIFQPGASFRIEAGYHEGPYGQIFQGEVKEQRRGKLNGTDKYHDFLAVSSGVGYTYGHVSETLPAGTKLKDIAQKAIQAMGQHGVTAGQLGDFGDKEFKRGVTLNAPAHDILRWVAETANMAWYIEHGKVNMVKNGESLSGGGGVISPDTGLIGVPEQTLTGVNIRVLIDPRIKLKQMITLKSSVTESIQTSLSGPYISKAPLLTGISADGQYRVERIDHNGSVLGQEWYTTLICVDPKKEGGAAGKGRSVTNAVTEVQDTGSGGGGGGS